jgi:hypothetical protein
LDLLSGKEQEYRNRTAIDICLTGIYQPHSDLFAFLDHFIWIVTGDAILSSNTMMIDRSVIDKHISNSFYHQLLTTD